jgi:hypothetical protein
VTERRIRALRVSLLIIATGIMAAMLLSFTGLLTAGPASGAPTGLPEPSALPAGASSTARVTWETPTPNLTLNPPRPTTPADEWANRILDLATPALPDQPPSYAGLSWWDAGALSGVLTARGSTIMLGSQPVDTGQVEQIDCVGPDAANPNRLVRYGTIVWQQAVLTLTAVAGGEQGTGATWLLSQSGPETALSALIAVAEARGLHITAAYLDGPPRLVLMSLASAGPPGESTPTAISPTGSPSPPTPSSTLIPAPELGDFIGSKLDLLIAAAASFDPEAAARFTENHPWAGALSWTEEGAIVSGRPTLLDQATELTFYMLAPDDPSGMVVRFMGVTFRDAVTYFPDDGFIFYGQRTEEIMYWLVRHAADRGLRVMVAYDGGGARQAITVTGFESLSAPPR